MEDVSCADEIGTKHKFYKDALSYWASIPPTVDGMLGGYGYISKTDVKGSTAFIKNLMTNNHVGNERALDCGAGIGRVTKNLLLPLFSKVDMLEVNKKFLDEAPTYIGAECGRVGAYICCGMQDFTPTEKYDIVWCQWVVGHLTDKHLSGFFRRCRAALNENGVICIKDNVTKNRRAFDDKDSSFTRTYTEMKRVVSQAGLTIIKEDVQQGFPTTIYSVPMLAFR